MLSLDSSLICEISQHLQAFIQKKKRKRKKAGNSTDPWILRLLTHQNPPKTGTVCPNKLSQYFTTQKRGSQCQRALKNVIPLDCVLAWTCPAKTARYQMMSEVELGLKLPCRSSLHPWCAAGMVSIKWLKIEVFDNPPERLWRQQSSTLHLVYIVSIAIQFYLYSTTLNGRLFKKV